jgi:hypothetical protein
VRGSKRSTGPGIARVTPFKVPDFDPGTYRISILAWDVPPSEGYGWSLPERFTVTRPGR